LASGVCFAGDKIQFTVPGNTNLAQKPEHEAKPDDDAAPAKFSPDGGAAAMSEFIGPTEAPTVVILKDQGKDRNKRDKLKAWDSGIKKFDSENRDDRDDLTDSDAKAAANPMMTNSYDSKYDSKSQWDSRPDSKQQGKTLFDTRSREDRFGGFAGQRRQDQSASRTGDMLSLLGSDKEDGTSKDRSDNDKDSQTGLSAWGKAVTAPRESYAERFEQYRSMYSAPSMNVGAPEGFGRSESSSDFGGAALNPEAMEDTWGARSAGPTGVEAFSAGDSTLGVSAFRAPDLSGSAGGYQTSARAAAPSSGAFQPMATPPIILSFPKKPGSLFQ
jgi:hypothetical protein